MINKYVGEGNRPQNPLEIVYKGVLRDFSPLFPCQFQYI